MKNSHGLLPAIFLRISLDVEIQGEGRLWILRASTTEVSSFFYENWILSWPRNWSRMKKKRIANALIIRRDPKKEFRNLFMQFSDRQLVKIVHRIFSRLWVQWSAETARKKEIRNLVSLDYWWTRGVFVSGFYAEILHVEKCFLMYISRLSLASPATTVADRFFFIVCNNSILWVEDAKKAGKNVASREIKIQFVMKVVWARQPGAIFFVHSFLCRQLEILLQ